MPHVDEGQLHAYLDRGPGDAATSEWATVDSHLAVCDDCQARLLEARRLRDRAQQILATVGPAEIDVPPFESVVARSAGRESGGGEPDGRSGEGEPGGRPAVAPGTKGTRGWRWGRFPLAWAATITVAVGAGWMARQVTMSSPEFESLASRPAAEVRAVPAEAPVPVGAQERADRVEAKLNDELAAGRIDEQSPADNRERAEDRAAGLAGGADLANEANRDGAADPRALAKSAVVSEEQLAGGEAGDRAQSEAEAAGVAAPARAELPGRDVAARVGVDDRRNAAEPQTEAIGALAQRNAPDGVVPAAASTALGCYALEADWDQAGAPALPERVRLLATAATPAPSAGEYFRDAEPGPVFGIRADPPSEGQQGFWAPLGTDSVLVRTVVGAGIAELRLSIAGGDLKGVTRAVAVAVVGAEEAVTEADAPAGAPPPVARGTVRGHRIDCEEMD